MMCCQVVGPRVDLKVKSSLTSQPVTRRGGPHPINHWHHCGDTTWMRRTIQGFFWGERTDDHLSDATVSGFREAVCNPQCPEVRQD